MLWAILALAVLSCLLLVWAFTLVDERRRLRIELDSYKFSETYWQESAMAMGKEVARLRGEEDGE